MFPSRLCRKTQVRQGVLKFGPAYRGGGPPRRHSAEGGLKSEEGAQAAADPSRDTHDPGDFFHENGTCFIQCLLAGNAVTVSCEGRLLQTGAEECCQEERRREGRAVSTQPIEPFKVRVK